MRIAQQALIAAAVLALTAPAAAQFPPPPPPPGTAAPPVVQDRWPQPAAPQRPVQTEPQPPRQSPPQSMPPQQRPQAEPSTAPPRPRAAAPANVVTCSGVFAKDSSHMKVATRYDSRNVTFGEVDGPDGSKIPATLIYPRDPKRRLEVLWGNAASRDETSVIAINGQSQWVAPKGLKLGLSLAALERINGRPFKLGGFDKSGTVSVTTWDGGALTTLPGGCKIGVRLAADRKATPAQLDPLSGDKTFTSKDAPLRAVNPTVMEILVGY